MQISALDVLKALVEPLIGVALKLLLQAAFLQHLPVLVQQFTVLGLHFSRPVSHLHRVVLLLEGRLQLPSSQFSPGEILEPPVSLEFLDPTPP